MVERWGWGGLMHPTGVKRFIMHAACPHPKVCGLVEVGD